MMLRYPSRQIGGPRDAYRNLLQLYSQPNAEASPQPGMVAAPVPVTPAADPTQYGYGPEEQFFPANNMFGPSDPAAAPAGQAGQFEFTGAAHEAGGGAGGMPGGGGPADFGGFRGLGGFGAQNYGPGWGKATAGVAGMVNPAVGLGLEAARRANNVSYANSQRSMLGMPENSFGQNFRDFFSPIGKGYRDASIGKVSIGGRPAVDVSYGGMVGDRTSYTPEEARRRQASQNYGGYRGGDSGGGRDVSSGYGGGGDDFDPSGRW